MEGITRISVELCERAIHDKFIKEFRMFMHFKSNCSGHFKLNKREAMAALGIKSNKTFSKRFKWLTKHKWITVNSIKKRYRLISMNQLYKRFKINSRTDVVYNKTNLKHIEEFAASALIGFALNGLQKSRRSSATKKDKIIQASKSDPTSSDYLGLSVSRLMVILKCSQGKASGLKSKSAKAGFLYVQKHFEKTGVGIDQLHNYIKQVPENKNRIKIYNGEIFLQCYDEILCLLKFKTRILEKR